MPGATSRNVADSRSWAISSQEALVLNSPCYSVISCLSSTMRMPVMTSG